MIEGALMKTNKFKMAAARFLTVTTITAFQLLGLAQQLASSDSGRPCVPVNTQLDGSIVPCVDSPVGLCAVGTVSSGVLKGTKDAIYSGASLAAGIPGLEPPSTLSYTGIQVFHTEKGDLSMKVIGVSDYVREVFTELGRITGGTGRFANATGTLFISGYLTPDGMGFRSRVTGEICLDQTSP